MSFKSTAIWRRRLCVATVVALGLAVLGAPVAHAQTPDAASGGLIPGGGYTDFVEEEYLGSASLPPALIEILESAGFTVSFDPNTGLWKLSTVEMRNDIDGTIDPVQNTGSDENTCDGECEFTDKDGLETTEDEDEDEDAEDDDPFWDSAGETSDGDSSSSDDDGSSGENSSTDRTSSSNTPGSVSSDPNAPWREACNERGALFCSAYGLLADAIIKRHAPGAGEGGAAAGGFSVGAVCAVLYKKACDADWPAPKTGP